MGLGTIGNTAILYCWIAIGSVLGGVARYWCSGVAARLFGETFPWGTLYVNVAGSFIIGFFATLTGPDGRIFAGSTMRQFVMLGLLRGFTTFSSFSLQTLNLVQDTNGFRPAATSSAPSSSACSRSGSGTCSRSRSTP